MFSYTQIHTFTGTNVQYPSHSTGALYHQLFAEKGLGMEALRNASQGDYTLGGDYRKLVGGLNGLCRLKSKAIVFY